MTTKQRPWITPLLDLTTGNVLKRDFFDSEVYFREAIADCLEVWPSETMRHLSDITSAILKPETFAGRMVETCCEFFSRNGFRIVAATALQVNRLMIRELWRYRFNIATSERLDVMDLLMSAAPSIYVVLDRVADERGSATALLKALKGPSAPDRREPHQLRYQLGRRSHLINYVHAPDELSDFVRELAILFDRETRQRILRVAATQEDRMEDAVRLGESLYGIVPEHDLSFDAAMRRLAISTHKAAEPTIVARIMEGASRDWRALFEAVESNGTVVPAWDRIVILAELIEMNLPGRETLL